MLAYYVVRFFSWIMCVAPKCLRNLTAAVLGGIAVVATPKWRLQMAMLMMGETAVASAAPAKPSPKGNMKI